MVYQKHIIVSAQKNSKFMNLNQKYVKKVDKQLADPQSNLKVGYLNKSIYKK